jgi:hypothetical protein
MKRIENQTFEYLSDLNSHREISNIEFSNCRFVACYFSSFDITNYDNIDLVQARSKAMNVRLINCDVTGGGVGPGVVENLVIDGLNVRGHLQTCGTVFKHVTVKGAVNFFMVTPYVDFGGNFPDVQRQFDDANLEYYKGVDWALDISQALFKDCDIRGIPSKLIRRDLETQVVVTREKVLKGDWKNIDLSNTHWQVSIENFLERGYEDCVLVAPKKARNFKKLLMGLNKLRDAGIAEAD